MSRSRKHLPIWGIFAGSDKVAKRRWNREFRRRTRHAIDCADDFDAVAMPANIHKETEFWDGRKEDKVWVRDWPKVYRK